MRLAVPSFQNKTLSFLATINLEVVPFRAYATFPALLPFSKCILEVVFCEGVQHRLQLCLHYLSCVKMMAFQFYLLSRKQKSKVGGDDSHIAFGKQFRGAKGSLRLRVVVMEHSFLLSPKFGAKSVHIFTQSV
jgi:hypothetical protein